MDMNKMKEDATMDVERGVYWKRNADKLKGHQEYGMKGFPEQ